MNIPKTISLAIILIFGIASFWFYLHHSPVGTPTTQTTAPVTEARSVQIKNKTYRVTVAKSDTEKAQGLGGVTSLAPDEGMLFDFSGEKNARPTFWMKDMIIPLDFVWIKNNVIVSLNQNVPAPRPTDEHLATYTTNSSVDYVLEISAGEIKNNNLKLGETVTIK